MSTELIVALDVPTPAHIPSILKQLPESVRFFKVGLELYTAAGPEALQVLHDHNKRIFLDLKLHDIPRTVARAVQQAAKQHIDLLTVHACGGAAMLEAAASAAEGNLHVVAVTVLTSLDQHDLTQIGVTRSPQEHVRALGQLAIENGIDGLVCSPLETRLLREDLGPEPILVTPGIRPDGSDRGDQKRTATPASAAADGSSFIVVGRPILEAPQPGAAAEAILQALQHPQGHHT